MANILAGVAAYETEVCAEGILAGQTAEPVLGVRWGGSAGGRSKVTVEQTVCIRRSRSEGQGTAAIRTRDSTQYRKTKQARSVLGLLPARCFSR
jgi:hypothetical protein